MNRVLPALARLAAGVGLGALLALPGAQAQVQTITQTWVFGDDAPGDSVPDFRTTDWGNGVGLFPLVANSFNTFDQSTGWTLLSVTILFEAAARGSVTFTNNDSSPQTFEFSHAATLRLRRDDPLQTSFDSEPALPGLGNISPAIRTDEAVALDGAPDSETFAEATSDIVAATATYSTVNQPATFALFSTPTPGSIGFRMRALATTSLTGGGNVTSTFATAAWGRMTLTYTLVPEPSTWALVAAMAGLMAAAVLRQRRV